MIRTVRVPEKREKIQVMQCINVFSVLMLYVEPLQRERLRLGLYKIDIHFKKNSHILLICARPSSSQFAAAAANHQLNMKT